MGARNFQRICLSASLNSSLMIICWLTPKSFPGNSENLDILRSGCSSQSDGPDVDDPGLVEPSVESFFSEELKVLEDCDEEVEEAGLCLALVTSKPGGGALSLLSSPSTVAYCRLPRLRGNRRARGMRGSPESSANPRLPNTLGTIRKVIF